MRKIRDVLRLKLDAKLSIRQISASTKVSVGAIQKLLHKTEALNLSWPLPDSFFVGEEDEENEGDWTAEALQFSSKFIKCIVLHIPAHAEHSFRFNVNTYSGLT